MMDSKLIDPAFVFGRLLTYSQGILGLEADDIILASFPKCGSTWVRFLLYHLLADTREEADLPSFEEMDATMPALGFTNLMKPWAFEGISRVIKTHMHYNYLFRKNRLILIIRDPRDTMVSFYHSAKASRRRSFEGEFGEFIRHAKMGLPAYFNHANSWLDRADLIICYEDLKSDCKAVLKRLATYCGLSSDDNRLERAIAFSSMRNVRKAQEASREVFNKTYSSAYTFAREGKVNQWQEYFDERCLEYFEKNKSKYGFTFYD